jgi:hypothetical protein
MASSLALIFHEDGTIEATAELKRKLRLAPGSRLELVEQEGSEFRFRAPGVMREINGWRDLEGILADSAVDPNDDLAQERISEVKRDLR